MGESGHQWHRPYAGPSSPNSTGRPEREDSAASYTAVRE